ncbi:hypothetical protein [Parerythrobacter jejuensis]|uniref:Uncharacterized protein n=1 Tax=Parerythrobacter jejuensis TaxID=795812 RepID=A0A845AXR9_9SPHN|nr:hypothetical protein [Parerythrobacter jejuensis]MXP31265.1 hypothetical protein [Parerythrobacter jejuensis]MXP34025.1 hypothetical protein [Parerythrobacter jejuensis]
MTAILHPARARRMRVKLPPRPHHDAHLRPLGQLGEGGALIVPFTEPSYTDALFADLLADNWQQRLLDRRTYDTDQHDIPRLSPPVHAKTNVILFELACAMPGTPPVAPNKIDSMGFVLRRLTSSGQNLIWRKQNKKPLGWYKIAQPAQFEADPDPGRQMELAPGKSDDALAAVAALRNQTALPAEEVFDLYRAPPDVCAKLGKTVLFGTLPLASLDTSPAAEDAVDYAALTGTDAEALNAHLSRLIQQGQAEDFDKAGQVLSRSWKAQEQTEDSGLTDLAELLRQSQNELGLEAGTQASRSLLAELNSIRLPMTQTNSGVVTSTYAAGDWLIAAAPILLGEQTNSGNLRMPLRWPFRSSAKGATLLAKAKAALSERAGEFQPDTPKFDNDNWLYHVKPFVRLSHGPECPIRLVWGQHSRTFRIRPWWDSDAPPVKIGLPDVSDLKDVKPNVAFEMPPILANLLNKDPKKLADGEGSKPSGVGLGWLCSFSIPIITICAFIVLNIFLSLFNIFFSWMLWIKICIPIPVKKEGA